MSKVNVNRRVKKSDMVKRSDLCIKTCSVNAAFVCAEIFSLSLRPNVHTIHPKYYVGLE